MSRPRGRSTKAAGPATSKVLGPGAEQKGIEGAASPGTTRSLAPHEALARPSCQNGAVVQAWGGFGDTDLSLVIAELQEKAREVIDGETKTMESLLIGQAMSLQTIFTTLAAKAARSEYITQLEPLMRIALKAQNQSRMTLETLAVIKNPPVVFARQANINQGGLQQVNNGVATGFTSASNIEAAPTELLRGTNHVEGMDAGTASAPGGADQQLEALGPIHGTAHRGREKAKRAEPLPGRRTAGPTRVAASGPRRDACPAGGARSDVENVATSKGPGS